MIMADFRRERTVCRILILFLALVMSAGLALAEETEKDWQPPPPMPDEFDWIQLTSGEWLKGEIIAMYDDSLEFDSDELDLLNLDWGDIKELRSAGVMQVGFLEHIVATGKLYVDGDTIRVMGDEDQEFERSLVLSITSGPPRESSYWSGKIGLGATFRSGNTDQTEANGWATITRRTVKNRIILDFLGAYNVTDDVQTANNQRASATWNRFISDRFFLAPLFGEFYHDPFQNIGQRWTLGTGLGYQIIDSPKVNWQVTAGPAYQYTKFDDVVEGESDTDGAPAVMVGTSYDNEITGSLDFNLVYRFTLTNEESGRYIHHFVTGFDVEMTSLLDFNIGLVWDRIQEPRPDSDGVVPEQDDYRFILGLGFSF